MTLNLSSFPSESDFARGFLISPPGSRLVIPMTWRVHDFHGYRISVDPRVDVEITENAALIGHAISATTGSASLAMHVCSLSGPYETYRRALDDLVGRFVALRWHNEVIELETDPVGLRGVYYALAPTGVVAGSHAALLADQIGAKPHEFASYQYLRGNSFSVLPGRITEFEDVIALTPNTALNLTTGAIRRIYFGPECGEVSVEEATQIVLDTVDAQLNALRDIKPLHVSLSAGLDSRVSMALLRDLIDHTSFFTYDVQYKPKTHADEHDRNIGVELAQRFGLKHHVVEATTRDIEPRLLESFRLNSPRMHARPIAAAYKQQVSGGLHIRSNVYEIGRAFYRGMGRGVADLDPREMVSIISARKSSDQRAVQAFEDFVADTQFFEADRIDPYDLFYWEHRMGMWMRSVLTESDVAHDTHVLINHRPTLDAMLSVSMQDRIDGSVLRQIIERRWPELLEVPVNGKLIDRLS